MKSKGYQVALEKARNLMSDGQIVPVRLVHQCYNPRDSRALAFVCDINSLLAILLMSYWMRSIQLSIKTVFILLNLLGFATLQIGPSLVQAFSLELGSKNAVKLASTK